MSNSEILELLQGCEIFKGLRKHNIDQICNFCRMETFAPGDYIFRQGDSGDLIYIVAQGHVFLERSMDLGTRKGTAVIGMLSKGKVFGCWSTLLSNKHTLMSSAVCRKPTKVLLIKGTDLRQMMMEDSNLGFGLLERLSFLLLDRLRGAYKAMENI
jgi:CRP-like cAMP-binding protein